jgi:hypothetical protein
MSRFTTVFALVTVLAPLGCDDSPADESAEIVNSDVEAPIEAVGPARVAIPEARGLVVDGQPRPDRLLAAVTADDDTRLYFIAGEADEFGNVPVDVTIVGRDGGFDYGALISSGEATALELFLAVTDEEPVPEALRLAHEREVATARRPDDQLRDLAVPGRPQAVLADDETQGESTFTCLNWSNFQSYMGSRFPGANGRTQGVYSSITATSTENGWQKPVHADLVACNFNSSNNANYNDVVIGELCYIDGFGGMQVEHCWIEDLWDGWYMRRVYGPIDAWRRFKIYVTPNSQPELQTYFGYVTYIPNI